MLRYASLINTRRALLAPQTVDFRFPIHGFNFNLQQIVIEFCSGN